MDAWSAKGGEKWGKLKGDVCLEWREVVIKGKKVRWMDGSIFKKGVLQGMRGLEWDEGRLRSHWRQWSIKRGQGMIDEEKLRQNKKKELKYLGSELVKRNWQIIYLRRRNNTEGLVIRSTQKAKSSWSKWFKVLKCEKAFTAFHCFISLIVVLDSSSEV